MIADVVDMDELETYERREGMYGSIFWWVVKLGMAAALAAGGFLLNFTGFDVALEGNQAPSTITLMRLFDAFVPFIASGVAIWIIAGFSITEERAREIRLELEQRRGSLEAPIASLPLPAGRAVPPRPAGQENVLAAAPRSSRPARQLYRQRKALSRDETIALYRGPVSLQGYFSPDVTDEDLRTQFRRVIDGRIHGLSFSPYLPYRRGTDPKSTRHHPASHQLGAHLLVYGRQRGHPPDCPRERAEDPGWCVAAT